jgi:hypothetical protein
LFDHLLDCGEAYNRLIYHSKPQARKINQDLEIVIKLNCGRSEAATLNVS